MKTRKLINKFGQEFRPSSFNGFHVFIPISSSSAKSNAPLRSVWLEEKKTQKLRSGYELKLSLTLFSNFHIFVSFYFLSFELNDL
jgi:hypothetical protein